MQNSEIVLINLSKQAKKKDFYFDRLYRILYNPQMYIKAYSNIYKNDGSSTSGIDGETADGFNELRINKILDSLKDESYQPKPAKRVYIPKKNDKKRPLGIPSFMDRVVQEICRMVLEAIYEPNFSDHSHGFRPNKSCHTALMEISRLYTGVNWFVEGDIKGFFDNIDHNVLINLLRKTIKDEKFIRLMWKFLRAGYVEDFKFKKTYSGTPQGGIISPILANIYLNELDKYVVDELKKDYDKGDRKKDQKRNPVYRNLEFKAGNLKKKINHCEIETERQKLLQEYKLIKQEMSNTRYIIDSTEFKRIKYVRYADDFIIGINGSKEDCQKIKQKIKDFLETQLKLELSDEKTLITHSSKYAKFLSYNICVGNNDKTYKNSKGIAIRNARRNIRLMMPKETLRNFISENKLVEDINAKVWKPIHRNQYLRLSDLEIVNIYNAEIRGMYNYFRLAENVTHKMWQLRYVMEYSCLKTLAGKHQSSVHKMINKLRNGKHWGIKYNTKKGESFCYFYNKGFVRDKTIRKDDPNVIPNTQMFSLSTTELERRISARKCEWCGKEDVPFEIHHVHRLKDLKGKELWEKMMIARNRKTLVLCHDCHNNIAHPQG
ncbi:TPA: group II intron reverse transcriptase/maturase [Bacillus cereus]|uniref:reverse transcriptase domain-containing protein n=1 Tax=Bacillus sp. FSL H8-0545 TaxID=2921402 RepID=UPI0030F65252|nr:group II intron reverse transcriptase/maturase [Bacillus cereus]HDR7611549.1 group II intron reverse transcriptase/maturase [Bacillus mycoides]